MNITCILTLILTLALGAMEGQAAPISSSPSLVNPSGIVFNNFSYTRASSAAVCSPANGSEVDVSINNWGDLRIVGAFAAVLGVCDHAIQFDITAPEEISLIGLIFNGFVVGNGFAQVVESVRDGENGNLLAQAAVDTNGPLQTTLSFPAKKSLRVTKDIQMWAGPDSHTTISVIEQNITLDQSEIPEPSTMAMAGVALMLVGLSKRR